MMLTIQLNGTNENNIFPDIKKYFHQITNDLAYNLVYKSLDYLSVSTKVNIQELQDILDMPNNVEFVKRIDLDKLYDDHYRAKDKISELHHQLKNRRDQKSKALYNLTENILDDFAKMDWIISDLEHLLIIENNRAS